MDSIDTLLIEPDFDNAGALAACLTRAFPGGRVLHAPSIEAVDHTDLRGVRITLCADSPPDIDPAELHDALLDRIPSAPMIALLDSPEQSRLDALLSHGVTDFLPRRGCSCQALAFTIMKCLGVARIERDRLRLHAGLTRSLAELVQRNRELVESADRLEEMASTDPLTRLNNRWWLKQRLDATFAVAARYGSDLACVMIDLDGFKSVNDTHGHQRGDRVLALTGEMIAREIRASDAAARYGGDEFVVIMPRADARTATHLAHRLRRAFNERVRPEAGADCSMCIGIACLSISRPGAAETLIRHADLALYAAKRAGPGEVRICGPDGAEALNDASFAA